MKKPAPFLMPAASFSGALKLNVVEKINDHVFLKRFDRVGK
jgi:hypothetical protein